MPPEMPPGASMPPGAPGPAGGSPVPRDGDPATKAQVLLVYQPLKMLYQPDMVKQIVTAAHNGDPAKVIASAAVSAVMASAKAGMQQGAPIQQEMLGNAVVEVIKGLGALLVSSRGTDPNDIPDIVNGAIQFAAQAAEGQAQEGGQPPQSPAGGSPGPGGVQPPGMAGAPQQPMGG